MSSLSFKITELFGGAMTVELPNNFMDASTIREVPDHQEVFLDNDGFTSIIFDILERVTGFDTDEAAAKFHVEDFIDGGDEIHVWSHSNPTVQKIPTGIPILGTFVTIHPGTSVLSSGSSGTGQKPTYSDFTGLFMILVRLAQYATDIVITINIPHVSGDYKINETDVADGRAGPHINKGSVIREAILRSFEIKDYGLFKPA